MKLQVNDVVNTVIQDKAGRIVATCWRSPKKKKTIAKEFVRRWNAFESGGIVEELRTALEKISDIEDTRYTHSGFDLEVNNIAKAALASNPIAKDLSKLPLLRVELKTS